jgi:thiamine biosynthesis lipoprotein ApbE
MDTPDNICRARQLLGTFVEIRSAGAVRAATEQAIDAAFAVIDKIHRLMSFHDPDSDVGRLNRQNAALPSIPGHIRCWKPRLSCTAARTAYSISR